MVLVIIFAFVVATLAVVVAGRRGLVGDARSLTWAGAAVTTSCAIIFGAFVIGETVVDLGGWKAAGLASAWMVPLGLLSATAWWTPGIALRTFEMLTVAAIAMSIWFAADPEGWRSFEDENLPVRAVITFTLGAAIGVLGLKRTAEAGVLLLVLGTIPVITSAFGSLDGIGSFAVVGSLTTVAGALDVLSAHAPRPVDSAMGAPPDRR